MERILVVCGAGASSSFLVHWMRKGAIERGLQITLEPGGFGELESLRGDYDVVLVGQHLNHLFAEIVQSARESRARVALLPPVTFDAAGASAALDIVYDLLERPRPAAPDSRPIHQTH
ncbi:MAG: hypothetical protein JWL94_715 [Microbacteriaceae bacterium]|nr:hypothetical protein [Microbacteriaceae bacterium]HEV7956185.1 PTS IIB subunit [Marisediminicola sp.]